MKSQIILGIDPGYGRCGYAVLEKPHPSFQKSSHSAKASRDKAEKSSRGQGAGNLSLLSFGVITTEPQTNFPERLREIAEDIETLLEKYRPQIVSIEDLFFVKNVSTGIDVAQVRGVILYLAHQAGAQICEPKPVEIKSAFTGNGQAGKPEMKKMAKLMFGLENQPTIDDAADAIGAAFYAVQNARFLP